MNEDRTAKLYAGQMGIVAVLVNVLIDKGVISQDELRERFEQAHEAASAMLRRTRDRGRPRGHADVSGARATGQMKGIWHVLELVVAIVLAAIVIAWLIAYATAWIMQGQ